MRKDSAECSIHIVGRSLQKHIYVWEAIHIAETWTGAAIPLHPINMWRDQQCAAPKDISAPSTAEMPKRLALSETVRGA